MGEITSLYFFDVVRVYVQNVASEEHIDAKFPIHFTLGSIVVCNARNTKENRYAYHAGAAAAMLTAYFNIAFCISVTVRIAQ